MNPMLAKPWKGQAVVGQWYAEPKLDGIRAVWTGTQLLNRKGVVLSNPPEVIALLKERFADCVLDGELCGVGWNDTASNVRRVLPQEGSVVKFWVFDLLEREGVSLLAEPFEYRHEALDDLLESRLHGIVAARICLVPCVPLNGDDPSEVGRRCIAAGYEGAMLKRASSPYLGGVRSNDWLKVKFDKEIDVVIVGAEVGKAEGRLRNTLGALVVKDATGHQFKVGGAMTDVEREELWQLYQSGALTGRIASVVYQPDARIRGRFPRFVRLRDDLDVLEQNTVEASA